MTPLPNEIVEKLSRAVNTKFNNLKYYKENGHMDEVKKLYDEIHDIYNEVYPWVQKSDAIPEHTMGMFMFLKKRFSRKRDPSHNYEYVKKIDSKVLGEDIYLVKESVINIGRTAAIHNGCAVYTEEEAGLISKDLNIEEKIKLHQVKKILGGEIICGNGIMNPNISEGRSKMPEDSNDIRDYKRAGVIKL